MLYLSMDDLGCYKYYAESDSDAILLLDTPRRFYKSRDVWGTII